MANVSRKEKQEEAIKRMKALGYFANSINDFKKRNKDGEVEDIHYSVMVNEPPLGAHYWVEEDLAKAIHKFEQENDALVYMVIRSYTELGKMDSYVIVSDYKEEWEYDWENINGGNEKYGNIFFTYTVNYDMPDCSEFGSIAARKTLAGGFMRTA